MPMTPERVWRRFRRQAKHVKSHVRDRNRFCEGGSECIQSSSSTIGRRRSRKPSACCRSNPDAKVLAGGHSLLPAMKLGSPRPRLSSTSGASMSLKGITARLAEPRSAQGRPIGELIDSIELAGAFPVIAEACRHIGDPAVRSRGTRRRLAGACRSCRRSDRGHAGARCDRSRQWDQVESARSASTISLSDC